MRVFREPCYFAEAVYLLYYFVNEVSYGEEFARICKCYCRKADEEEEGMMRRIQELTRVSRVVTADLDRESPKLRHYFEKLPGLEKRPAATWMRLQPSFWRRTLACSRRASKSMT